MTVLGQSKDDTSGRDRRVSWSPPPLRLSIALLSTHLHLNYSAMWPKPRPTLSHLHADIIHTHILIFRYMAPEMVDKREEKAGYDWVSTKKWTWWGISRAFADCWVRWSVRLPAVFENKLYKRAAYAAVQIGLEGGYRCICVCRVWTCGALE